MLILALAAAALEPAASVNIPFDRKGEASASADGLADIAASRRRVTQDDSVRVGSIQKVVVGVAVMRPVETSSGWCRRA